MASTDDEAVVFGDKFLANKILARLPARCAARCTVLSKHFRQLVTTSHFWLRQCRHGAPPEHPHAARLYRQKGREAFDFHAVGPAAFAMKHTVEVERNSSYCSTCNGLVLVSRDHDQGDASVDGVVFNPATKEEARLSLPLPHPQNKHVACRIMAFGYGPSSKVYKALIREDGGDTTWLMVVTLGGSNGQEPRKVLSCPEGFVCHHTLHTGDGKVYFLRYDLYFTGEEGREVDKWEAMSVLAFDIDNEVVTSIAFPEGNKGISFMMLQIHGRPCIYQQKGGDTMIWLLTPDDRWEQLHILVKESSPPSDNFLGAWECGRGRLFALFRTTSAYVYNLHEAVVKKEEGNKNMLLAVSSLAIEYEWPEPLTDNPTDLLDYQPTLISPASIFSDAAGHRESVSSTNKLDGMFLETTPKLIIDPAVEMQTNL